MSDIIRRRPKTPFALNPHSFCGQFLFLSGITAEDPEQPGHFNGDIAEQTDRALTKLRNNLGALNAEIENAASVSVYLKRGEDFEAMNEVYRRHWPVNPPTRTTIVAGLSHPEALVEVSAMIVPRGNPRDIIRPESWSASLSPYNYGILSGRTFFMSGLVAENPRDHSTIKGDIRIQTRAILENARELLAAANLKFDNVVSSRIYISNASHFEAMHSVYRTYFPLDPPACTTIVTDLMSSEFLVEITLLAINSKYRLSMPPQPEHGSVHLSAFQQAEGRLFVSGMRGDTLETRHDVSAQTRELMNRLTKMLKRARFTWREMREILIYVSDIDHAPAVLYEIAPFLPVYHRPAGSIVQTGILSPGSLVEVSGSFSRDRWRWR